MPSRKQAIAIRHVVFEDLGNLGDVLVDFGYSVNYVDIGLVDINQESVQSQLAAADLLIVLGGPLGVGDIGAYPILGTELRILEFRLHENLPTLGICLGAQLLAVAAGGSVRATGQHEIGFGPLNLTEAAGTSPLRHTAEVSVLHWHGDEFTVPPDGTLLASTKGFPQQAFALGTNALALQFHLEVDSHRIEQWLVGHAHELAAVGIAPDSIREDAAEYGPRLTDVAQRVWQEWLTAI